MRVIDTALPLCYGSACPNRGFIFPIRQLQGTHKGLPRSSYLDYYLEEFVFRFNRRTSRSRGLLFYHPIQQVGNIDPFKRQEIPYLLDLR